VPRTTVSVAQDDENPIEVSVLATAIVNIDKGVQQLLNSGLKEEAIMILVAAKTGVPKGTIRNVLHSLRDLRKDFCTR
jgi:hypothetical protein